LVLAWFFVAVWFWLSLWVNLFIAAGVLRIMGRLGDGVLGSIPRTLLYWRALEALVLTLFASLWFDSLGSGEWWLVFLLVGILASVPVQLLRMNGPDRKWTFAVAEAGDLLRYLVAGALLAWRLS
jgi:hypothetical protein